MARIHRIDRSRKEVTCSKCREVLPVGSPYLKATPYHARPIIRCIKCGLKSYETSGSDFIQSVGRIAEDWSKDYSLGESTAEEISEALGDIRDQCEENYDNIPDSLKEAPAGEILQERIDMLEDVINELDNISWDDILDEAKDEVESTLDRDDYDSDEEYEEALESEAKELAEDNLEEEINEALSGLEY